MRSIVLSAPGKVILYGEHAVVYGKNSLAASLNLRTFLRLSKREDQSVTLHLPDIDFKQTWPLDILTKECASLCEKGDLNNPVPAMEDTIKNLKRISGMDVDSDTTKDLAIVTFLYLYIHISRASNPPLPAVDVHVSSQLPIGAGLGSSGSYCVCLAVGLLLLGGHINQSCCSSETESDQSEHVLWSHDETELINKWAFVGEKVIHGNPSGVDNSVATFGGALCFRKGNITKLPKMSEIKILLIDTKIPRSTKTLVANVRKKYEKYEGVISPIMDAIDALVLRCCAVFTKLMENNSSENYEKLEELIDINQGLLVSIGVGHPQLDRICQITMASGLHSKLTGAGGGGCAFCLLRPDTPTAIVKEVMSHLQEQGFECWETNICSQGVVRHLKNNDEQYSIPADLIPV